MLDTTATHLNVDEVRLAVKVAEALKGLLKEGETPYGAFWVQSAEIVFDGDEAQTSVVYIDDDYMIQVNK